MVISNLYREKDLIYHFKIQTLEGGGRSGGDVTTSTVGGKNISTRSIYIFLQHFVEMHLKQCVCIILIFLIQEGGSAADRGRDVLDDQKHLLMRWEGMRSCLFGLLKAKARVQ